MKLCTSLIAALVILVASLSPAEAQTTLYWDTNGSAAGATVGGFADGTWDTATANWNPVADGTGTTTTWTAGDDAVFSAGSDVLNDPVNSGAFVTVDGTQVANSVLIEEGYVNWSGGAVDSPAITVNSDATLAYPSVLNLANTPGKVTLVGGALQNENPGNAGTFLWTGKELEIDGTGIVSYDDGSEANNFVSIFSGTITGVGGTVDNGGAGTLIKRGPDRVAQSGANQANNTYAKLLVEEGMFQARHVGAVIHDTVWGAVPLVETPDAVTLNGANARIGANASFEAHPNRGFTIGPEGGTWWGDGFGTMTINGPFSGSGTLTMRQGGGGLVLAHPNNVNTFNGNIVMHQTTLTLAESLNTPNLSGTGGAVSVAADKTFTFGSDNADTTFEGRVRGAGTWRKVGTGTVTFTGALNDHSGDTVIEAGTLSITNPYLADEGDVFLTTGAMLDLNFSGADVIDSLFFDGMAQAVGTWGAPASGADFESSFFSGTGLLQVTTMDVGGLDGDYNMDGRVDAADYVVWRKNIGTQQAYDTWVNNFGAGSGSGSGLSVGGAGAVPEPASVALLVFGLVALGAARRVR